MDRVGVRGLKDQTSRIVRRVREQGETIEVTYRGRVIARIVPVEQSPSQPEEMGARWPAGVLATDTVREGRRKL